MNMYVCVCVYIYIYIYIYTYIHTYTSPLFLAGKKKKQASMGKISAMNDQPHYIIN